jgi:hypothetical protein
MYALYTQSDVKGTAVATGGSSVKGFKSGLHPQQAARDPVWRIEAERAYRRRTQQHGDRHQVNVRMVP